MANGVPVVGFAAAGALAAALLTLLRWIFLAVFARALGRRMLKECKVK